MAMREIDYRKSDWKMRAVAGEGLRLCKRGRPVGLQDRAPWSQEYGSGVEITNGWSDAQICEQHSLLTSGWRMCFYGGDGSGDMVTELWLWMVVERDPAGGRSLKMSLVLHLVVVGTLLGDSEDIPRSRSDLDRPTEALSPAFGDLCSDDDRRHMYRPVRVSFLKLIQRGSNEGGMEFVRLLFHGISWVAFSL